MSAAAQSVRSGSVIFRMRVSAMREVIKNLVASLFLFV